MKIQRHAALAFTLFLSITWNPCCSSHYFKRRRNTHDEMTYDEPVYFSWQKEHGRRIRQRRAPAGAVQKFRNYGLNEIESQVAAELFQNLMTSLPQRIDAQLKNIVIRYTDSINQGVPYRPMPKLENPSQVGSAEQQLFQRNNNGPNNGGSINPQQKQLPVQPVPPPPFAQPQRPSQASPQIQIGRPGAMNNGQPNAYAPPPPPGQPPQRPQSQVQGPPPPQYNPQQQSRPNQPQRPYAPQPQYAQNPPQPQRG